MKIAIRTFFGPDRVHVVEGRMYPDDHDHVKRWPDAFADPDSLEARKFTGGGFVEATTARPGEVRNVTPPDQPAKKSSAKK